MSLSFAARNLVRLPSRHPHLPALSFSKRYLSVARVLSAKFFESADDAVSDIGDSSSVMVGGFGVCGIPENLIAALTRRGSQKLTVITSNAGTDRAGVGRLAEGRQVGGASVNVVILFVCQSLYLSVDILSVCLFVRLAVCQYL